MLAVLMAVLVVLGLGVVAVQDTVSGISQSAQGRVLVQTVDAAEAGIQAELAQIQKFDSTTPYPTQLPCSSGAVTVASASNRAGDSSYILSVSQPFATAQGTVGAPLTQCPASPASPYFINVTGGSFYILIQSAGSTVASAGRGTGRTLQALVAVGENPGSPTTSTTSTTTSTIPTTTTTVASPTYNSAASAKAMNMSGFIQPYSSTPISAANTGSGSNTPVTSQGALSPPSSDGVVVPLQSLTAEANTNGSSYSCASVLSSGYSMNGGSVTTPCSISGTGSSGGSINFLTLPVVGSSLTSLVAAMTLNFTSVTSWATGNAGGTQFSGSSTIVGATVTVKLLLGIVSITTPVTLPSPLTSSTDILAATLKAILNDPLLGSALSNTLSGVLTPVVSVTGGYHTLVNGVYTQSGIHIASLGGIGFTADLGLASVGPNTINAPPTTTTIPTTTTLAPATTTTLATAPPTLGVTVVSIRQV
jgi:mucin-6/19